jgi:hypothetical protein
MKHVLITEREVDILLEAVQEAQEVRQISMKEYIKENGKRFDNDLYFRRIQVDYNRTEQVIQNLQKRLHFSENKS